MGILQSIYDETFKEKIESLSIEQIEKIDEGVMSDIMLGIIDETSKVLDATLMDTIDEHINKEDMYSKEFCERLKEQWGEAFKLSKALSVISLESVEAFFEENNEVRFDEEAKIYNLQRLHARACRMSDEILCLLKAGYPDAGLARWRSLYEVAVISTFLAENDNELSERYLDYAVLESYKEMLLYNQYSNSLNANKFTKDEIGELKNKRDELLAKYGKEYKEQYGWAARILTSKYERNFKGIEQFVSLDHLRPYYKWACNKAHAGSKGNDNHLGLMNGHNYILVGPSNYGFADVGHCTAIALNIVTVNVLTYRPTIDTLVVAKIMTYFTDRISNTYLNIQRAIEGNVDEDCHN